MKIGKAIMFTVVLLLVGGIVLGCLLLGQLEKECTHNYYLSDYVAATAQENGYNEYTCSNCGDSYEEVIPALGEENPQEAESQEKQEEEPSIARNVPLFSLPVYSSSDDNVVNDIRYEADILDIDGYHHKDCYQICCSRFENIPCYRRWELQGKYSQVSGTIYMRQGEDTSFWLEFYDGEQLIHTTKRLSKETTVVSFDFDVTDVNFLTMYAWCEGSEGAWIIADNIYISTKTE